MNRKKNKNAQTCYNARTCASMRRKEMKPIKLSEVQDKIVAAIQKGAFISMAAESAGVPRLLLYSWLKRGHEESSGPYRDFYYLVIQAMREAELKTILAISGKKE